MKIIKEGSLRYERKPLKFGCKNCKTVFEAEKTEYEYCGDQREGDNYKCECPLCHKWYITIKRQPANKWS